jgi:hypothetical protein
MMVIIAYQGLNSRKVYFDDAAHQRSTTWRARARQR